MVERKFGKEIGKEFEMAVSHYKQGNQVVNKVENLPRKDEFKNGVEHMNQVIAYERLVYFGYLQEKMKDPELY